MIYRPHPRTGRVAAGHAAADGIRAGWPPTGTGT